MQMHTHTHTHKHTHTHTHTLTHTMHANAHTHTYTHKHRHTHTHTHKHRYTHTHTHEHTTPPLPCTQGGVGAVFGQCNCPFCCLAAVSLASAAPNWGFLPSAQEEIIFTMEQLLSRCRKPQPCCLRIISVYKIACVSSSADLVTVTGLCEFLC